jgi:hypothetical protein
VSGGDKDNPVLFTISEARAVLLLPTIEKQMARRVNIDRTHWDIPYLAGYSEDGRTIYLDRDLPASFVLNGRKVPSDELLILHERVEKSLIDALREAGDGDQVLLACLRMKSSDDRVYEHCHGAATRIEMYAVMLKYGHAALSAYDAFMRDQVKRAEDERIRRVPRDLDMTPYHDNARLRAVMERAMKEIK